MTSNFSSPLNSLGTSKSAIYRPKYNAKTANPAYSLERPVISNNQTEIGLFTSIQALEEWYASEESQKKDQNAQWRQEKLKALSVCISSPPNQEWNSIILKACKEWESSLSNTIKFVITNYPEKSDICFNWSDTPIKGRDFEVGHTDRQITSPKWIIKANITLIKEPAIDRVLPLSKIQERMHTTVLHELGHALGLEHSECLKDVMHHQGWQNDHLSLNDIKRFNDLYDNNSSIIAWI